ncbi:MAG TPA: cbb3-type cytochrome c oxidase N-terminal domain-containing protein [Gemmatimonadales bacterium]|nr:cbb3-type cytochrome c oxidase N-terminal domain-containing protein [Gemmatimonadales bacterium]
MSESRERNQVLGHASESDGIEEYDNPLPDWWLGLFVGCIVWAFAYTAHYHFIAHRSQVKSLAAEMAAARLRWPDAGRAATVVFSKENVERGEAIYKANCTGCHGDQLEGKIGPSLVDSTWIHGGTAAEVVQTITAGVPAKGMITWGPILGPEKIGEVAAYVLQRNHAALGIAEPEADEHDDKAKAH